VDVDQRVAQDLVAAEPAPDPHDLRAERRARELLDAPGLLGVEDEGLDLDPLGVGEGELERLLLAVEDLGARRRRERQRGRDEARAPRRRSRSPG
jgi:hypothetical protein